MVAVEAITTRRAWEELTTVGLAAGQSTQQIRNAINGAFTAEGLASCDPR